MATWNLHWRKDGNDRQTATFGDHGSGLVVVGRTASGRYRFELFFDGRRQHPDGRDFDTIVDAKAHAEYAIATGQQNAEPRGAARDRKAPPSRFEIRGVREPQVRRPNVRETERERRQRQLDERWAYSSGMAHYRRRGGISAAARRQ